MYNSFHADFLQYTFVWLAKITSKKAPVEQT